MADSSNEISDNFFFIAAFVVWRWEFNFLYKKKLTVYRVMKQYLCLHENILGNICSM